MTGVSAIKSGQEIYDMQLTYFSSAVLFSAFSGNLIVIFHQVWENSSAVSCSVVANSLFDQCLLQQPLSSNAFPQL